MTDNKFSSVIVENIINGSLDSMPSPSPSVKTQIMGSRHCLQTFENKKFVDITQHSNMAQ